MRLLSWNVQAGGGKRATDIVRAVQELMPDVAVLCELRSSSRSMLESLAAGGWQHQHIPDLMTASGSVGIASRVPIESVREAPTDAVLRGRWTEAYIPAIDLHTVGIYGPLQDEPYDAFWLAARESLVRRLDQAVIVTGDLNTGEPLLDSPKASFFCAKHLAALKSIGYVDAWRQVNGGCQEYSWYSRGSGGIQLNGFRLDHALLSPAATARLRAARYVHELRERKVSDHSALLLELET